MAAKPQKNPCKRRNGAVLFHSNLSEPGHTQINFSRPQLRAPRNGLQILVVEGLLHLLVAAAVHMAVAALR